MKIITWIFFLSFHLVSFSNKTTYKFPQGEVIEKYRLNKAGEMNGRYRAYRPNGVKIESGRYKKDMKVGTWREFYSNGITRSKTKYGKYGMKHGGYTSYHQNGNVYEKGEYRYNLKTGLWRTYNYSGELIKREVYKSY